MTTYSDSFNNDEIRELLAKLGDEIGEMKFKDLIGINLGGDLSKRLTEVETQQERITKHLDKFISVLTYSEQVQDQLELIKDQLDKLWDEAKTVELLKGVIELPKSNTGGQEKEYLDFYTIKATGECGMSLSTLARLAGVNKSSISRLENTLLHKAPSHYLESYTGQNFTLMRSDQITYTIDGQDVGNLTLYKSDYCAAVITHYSMRGNKVALHYLANYCAMGMTKWIHGITGYNTAK